MANRVQGIAGGIDASAESITATSDGALIFSSFAGGRISRAAPGAKEADEWIKPGTNGLLSVLSVLADESSNTLLLG